MGMVLPTCFFPSDPSSDSFRLICIGGWCPAVCMLLLQSAISAAAAAALASAASLRWAARRQGVLSSRRVLLAVSGTLQDGYVLRRNLDADGAPARFVGWALVRGVRLYIDTKAHAQCREHVPVTASGRQQNVNPAAVCTGDARDANVYAVYAVSEAAALRALIGEPRCLGMTPDTALVDLQAEETSANLRSFLARSGSAEAKRAAVLTVVAHTVPPGATPAAPLYVKDDGTRVTSFAGCLRAFAGAKDDADDSFDDMLESATRQAQSVANGSGGDVYGTTKDESRVNFVDEFTLASLLREAPGATGPPWGK